MTGGNFQSSVFVGKKFRLAKLLLADPFESACLKRAEYLQPFMIMVSDEPDSKTRDIDAETIWRKRAHQNTPTSGLAGRVFLMCAGDPRLGMEASPSY